MHKSPIDTLLEQKADASIDKNFYVQLTRTHNTPEVDTLLLDLISLKDKEYKATEKLIELIQK